MVNIDYLNKCCNNNDFGPFISSYEAYTECGVKIVFNLFKGGIKGCLVVPKYIKKIIAITINKTINNYPGPILFWLATSKEWECGEKQNEFNSNAPYCINSDCTLKAPSETPDIQCLIGKKTYFSYLFKSGYCVKEKEKEEDFYKNFVKNGIVIYGSDKYRYHYKNSYAPCCPNYNDLNIIDKAQLCYTIIE